MKFTTLSYLTFIVLIFSACFSLLFEANEADSVIVKLFKLIGQKDAWGEGENWADFYRAYDNLQEKIFPDCDRRYVSTSFGETYVHDCQQRNGIDDSRTVVLLPGAGASVLQYKYLFSHLTSFHVFAIDYICDTGKSQPIEELCPKTIEENASWLKEVIEALGIRKASFVGNSYGTFLTASLAKYYPEVIDRAIMTAPAGVFQPIQMKFYISALATLVLYPLGFDPDWFDRLLQGPENKAQHFQDWIDFMKITRKLNAQASIKAIPVPFEDETLQQMTKNTRVFVLVGEHEFLSPASSILEKAHQVGVAKAIELKGLGHLAAWEEPTLVAEMTVSALTEP